MQLYVVVYPDIVLLFILARSTSHYPSLGPSLGLSLSLSLGHGPNHSARRPEVGTKAKTRTETKAKAEAEAETKIYKWLHHKKAYTQRRYYDEG